MIKLNVYIFHIIILLTVSTLNVVGNDALNLQAIGEKYKSFLYTSSCTKLFYYAIRWIPLINEIEVYDIVTSLCGIDKWNDEWETLRIKSISTRKKLN